MPWSTTLWGCNKATSSRTWNYPLPKATFLADSGAVRSSPLGLPPVPGNCLEEVSHWHQRNRLESCSRILPHKPTGPGFFPGNTLFPKIVRGVNMACRVHRGLQAMRLKTLKRKTRSTDPFGFKWKKHIVVLSRASKTTKFRWWVCPTPLKPSLTHTSLAIAQVGWNNHCPSLPHTHFSEAQVHSQHHLSRSQHDIVSSA
jgi:hypothetical protein